MLSIITVTKRPSFIENILQKFFRQKLDEIELIVILHGFNYTFPKDIQGNPAIISIEAEKNTSLGSCLNMAVKHAKYTVIARFDDDDYYGQDYLLEALDYMKQMNCDIVGKQSIFVYFEEDAFLALLFPGKEKSIIDGENEMIAGSTLVFKKRVAEQVPFPPISVGEDTIFLKQCKKKNVMIFASSHFNYVYIRYHDSHHSSDAGKERIKKHCLPIGKVKGFEDYVTDKGR